MSKIHTSTDGNTKFSFNFLSISFCLHHTLHSTLHTLRSIKNALNIFTIFIFLLCFFSSFVCLLIPNHWKFLVCCVVVFGGFYTFLTLCSHLSFAIPSIISPNGISDHRMERGKKKKWIEWSANIAISSAVEIRVPTKTTRTNRSMEWLIHECVENDFNEENRNKMEWGHESFNGSISFDCIWIFTRNFGSVVTSDQTMAHATEQQQHKYK